MTCVLRPGACRPAVCKFRSIRNPPPPRTCHAKCAAPKQNKRQTQRARARGIRTRTGLGTFGKQPLTSS
eukprot:9227142-Lingulodinium_polyedra.AAC.2